MREPSCPILASLVPTVIPGASAGTRKTAIPVLVSVAGAVRAKTTNRPASVAFVMNCLLPLMIQSSPSGFAVVLRPAGLDPAPGSVSANDGHHVAGRDVGQPPRLLFVGAEPN